MRLRLVLGLVEMEDEVAVQNDTEPAVPRHLLRTFCANCIERVPMRIWTRSDGVPIHLCDECFGVVRRAGGAIETPDRAALERAKMVRSLS